MSKPIINCDVCIVGGSLAGNYLSSLLSKTGLSIIVIEEHKEIGTPLQCAGIVSKKLLQLIDIPNGIILNRVKTAKIFGPSNKFIELSGDEEPYIIDRIALDRFFYQKNKEYHNILYYLDEKFKNFQYLKRDGQKLIQVETTKRFILARILIGCDGPISTVGKQLHIHNNVIYGIQIHVKGNYNEDKAYLYFDPQWKELFGWIIPEGNKIYRIGLASANKINEKFKIFLKKLNISIKDKISQQGGIIPIGKMNRLAFDNILLLGDSACQVKASTGGGIIMLLNASKIAARCIVKCFKKNTFSRKMIKKNYEKPCTRTLGKQLKYNFIIRLFLETLDKSDFDEFFNIIKINNIEKIISLYGDMDFPRSLIYRLVKNFTFLKFLFQFLRKNPKFFLQLIKTFLSY
jgi:digeranylgeranylglycerophospholipid reductase